MAPPEGAGLRAATARAHEQVDAIFSRFDLATVEGYRDFLAAQAEAFLPVEAALDAARAELLLPDWPDRRRGSLLRSDLAELGVEATPENPLPPLSNAGSILGAAYVIEGSRLGGSMLRKSVPPSFPRRFLDAPQSPGSWRKLLDNLDRHRYEPGFVGAAVQAAENVFERFAAAGLRYLESGRA